MSTESTDAKAILNFESLRSFVRDHHQESMARAMIKVGPIDLYVRLTTRVLDTQWKKTIDLADITIPTELRNQKLFSRVLREFETLAVRHNRCVFVESIINPIIRNALERRGYSFRDGELGSAWKSSEDLQRDDHSIGLS